MTPRPFFPSLDVQYDEPFTAFFLQSITVFNGDALRITIHFYHLGELMYPL